MNRNCRQAGFRRKAYKMGECLSDGNKNTKYYPIKKFQMLRSSQTYA